MRSHLPRWAACPCRDTYRKLSFWHDTVPGTLEPGEPLPRRYSTPTWRSSGPGSPACGPRTTWPAPTRACGSWSASARSPGSALRAGTAGGARRCSRRRWASWSGWRARRGHRHAAGDAGDGRRGRPGGRRRGHRLSLGQGRDGAAGPFAGPAGAGEGRDRRGAVEFGSARRTCGCCRRRRPARCRARPTCWAARSRRTAPRSTRRGWCAGWPRRAAGRGVSLYERSPVHRDRPGPGGHRRPGRCGRGTWSGRPRATRRCCPA